MGDILRAKVSVLGHFGEGKNLLNGQTVKTKIVTEELTKRFGKENVLQIDTHGGWKTLLKAPLQALFALQKSDNVIIFPAHNGLRVYAPLLIFLNIFLKKRKLHYVVIGGWLPEFVSKRKLLSRILKQFDAIYVETKTMKTALEEQGFENIYVMPNCKNLRIVSEQELVYPSEAPYKLCTFSRVMKEKGIEDAVNAVITVNNELGYQAFSLDIYGQVDTNQTEWFDNLKKSFPDYIHYNGLVSFNESVEVLKQYFALLFPTRFYTEGIPGTIIDAYAAGVPVISARWESYSDIIDERKTGIGYEFCNEKQFKDILLGVASNPKMLLDMKINCIHKASDYIPKKVIQVVIEKIGV